MRALTILVAVLTLTACAPRFGPGPAPSTGLYFFVSPNGQPFRFAGSSTTLLRPWFEAADADHDSRIARTEFTADAARFFTEVDADRDGAATSPEVSAVRRERAPELETWISYAGAPSERRTPPRWSPEDGFVRERSNRPPPRIVVANLLNEREPVLASDADLNRLVTRAEYEAATVDRFRRLDTNGDGALAMGELEVILSRRTGSP